MARLYQHDVFILIVSITMRLGSIFGLIVDLSPHFTTLLLCHCPLPWSPNIPLMPIPPRSRFRLRRQNRHNPVLFHLASEFMAAGDLPCVFSPPKIRGNNWRFWSQSPWFPLVKSPRGVYSRDARARYPVLRCLLVLCSSGGQVVWLQCR